MVKSFSLWSLRKCPVELCEGLLLSPNGPQASQPQSVIGVEESVRYKAGKPTLSQSVLLDLHGWSYIKKDTLDWELGGHIFTPGFATKPLSGLNKVTRS